MSRYVIAALLASVALLGWVTEHYYSRAAQWREDYLKAAHVAETRQKTIIDMQSRQRVVADIDAKYTGELTDAKATIAQLERSVIAGTQRLHVNATCKPVSKTTGSAGLDDATRAGLNDTAQRDYFTLRKRIETARSQIAGLQDYIRNVCLIPKD